MPDALSSPATTQELVQDSGCSERVLLPVLESLERLGLVDRREQAWRLTTPGAELLGAGSPGRGQLAQFGYNAGAWPKLAAVGRSGVPADGLTWPQWAIGADMSDPWKDRTAQEAEILARCLSPLPADARFYDIGCGDGRVTQALLDANPSSTAVMVDRALVLDATVSRMPHLSARIEGVVADAFTLDHRGDAALVVLANILHSYTPADCQRLIVRAAAHLGPRGRLVVRDMDRTLSSSGIRHGLDFSLHMALLSKVAGAHHPVDVQQWMQDAGLSVQRLDGYPQSTGCFALVGVR